MVDWCEAWAEVLKEPIAPPHINFANKYFMESDAFLQQIKQIVSCPVWKSMTKVN